MTIRNTIAEYLSRELQSRQMSQRALAMGAGISESVVRNLLKHGIDPQAKDPDAHTLRAVADYLSIAPSVLFQLAGYLPSPPDAHTVRADFVAGVFDHLSPEKQDAVLGVIEALTDHAQDKLTIPEVRANPNNDFAGFDLYTDEILMLAANRLILTAQADYASDLDKPGAIPLDLSFSPIGPPWAGLDEPVRQRILGLAKAKLNLRFEPTMVDIKWRKG